MPKPPRIAAVLGGLAVLAAGVRLLRQHGWFERVSGLRDVSGHQQRLYAFRYVHAAASRAEQPVIRAQMRAIAAMIPRHVPADIADFMAQLTD